MLLFDPETAGASTREVGDHLETPRRAGRWGGGAEGPRVLTAAGYCGRPGLAQVGVHRDPGRACGNGCSQSEPPGVPGAVSRGVGSEAAARGAWRICGG